MCVIPGTTLSPHHFCCVPRALPASARCCSECGQPNKRILNATRNALIRPNTSTLLGPPAPSTPLGRLGRDRVGQGPLQPLRRIRCRAADLPKRLGPPPLSFSSLAHTASNEVDMVQCLRMRKEIKKTIK